MHEALRHATLVNGIVTADLGPIDALYEGADWPVERHVTSTDLVEWVHIYAQAHRVVLHGARLVYDGAYPASIDLTDFRCQAALVLRDCLFECPLDLDGATTGRLEFWGCEFQQGLRLRNARVLGGLAVTGSRFGAVDGVSVAGSGAVFEGAVVLAGKTRLDGGLHLAGATIGGHLAVARGAHVAACPDGWTIDGEGLTVAQDLFIRDTGTRLGGGVRLAGATIGGKLAVSDGAHVAAGPGGFAISGENLNVAQGVFIQGDDTRLGGALRLVGAKISSQLVVVGAHIAADLDGQAIDGDGLNLSQGLFILGDDTRLGGALRLGGATIGGQLGVSNGAHVAADPDGRAIDGEGLYVAQSLYVQGADTRIDGGLRLIRATIEGQLTVQDGAHIVAGPDGQAIEGYRISIASGLYVRGADTRLDGGLHLAGATIGGYLGVGGGAHVAGDLDLEAGVVSTLVMRSGTVGGAVILSNARMQCLLDTPQGWEQVAGGWRLPGVTIGAMSGTLEGDDSWTTAQRIDWLRQEATGSRQPFTQVAKIYRQAGHRRGARRIARAGEKVTSGRFRRMSVGMLVGYGHQPWRAAIVGVALVLLAWGAAWGLGGDGLFTATNAQDGAACPRDYPCLNQLVYVTETVVPVLNLGQRDAWRIDTTVPYGDVALVGQYVLDGLGWLLALLVVGAVTGVVRRD